MTWKPHLNGLIGSLKQRQIFINARCHGKRGAPTAFASTIVKSVVISKIDNGSFIYGSAKKCQLKKLDTTLLKKGPWWPKIYSYCSYVLGSRDPVPSLQVQDIILRK